MFEKVPKFCNADFIDHIDEIVVLAVLLGYGGYTHSGFREWFLVVYRGDDVYYLRISRSGDLFLQATFYEQVIMRDMMNNSDSIEKKDMFFDRIKEIL